MRCRDSCPEMCFDGRQGAFHVKRILGFGFGSPRRETLLDWVLDASKGERAMSVDALTIKTRNAVVHYLKMSGNEGKQLNYKSSCF